MEKNDILYVAKVDLCKDAYFYKSSKDIMTTNKLLIKEIIAVQVINNFIVF